MDVLGNGISTRAVAGGVGTVEAAAAAAAVAVTKRNPVGVAIAVAGSIEDKPKF